MCVCVTGLFEAILGPEDAVISDALNHASIIDGVRLCKAKRFRYDHMDMARYECVCVRVYVYTYVYVYVCVCHMCLCPTWPAWRSVYRSHRTARRA
jgi:hypothetical protein